MPFNLSAKTIFEWLTKFLSDEIPESERIHPEFKYHNHDNGFHYNASGIGFVDNTHHLQVFLGKDELTKLDHSPFIGKIALNTNDTPPYDYCAFFYLNGDQKFAQLEQWASEQGFRKTFAFQFAPTDYSLSPR